MDMPNERSSHAHPTPRGGGLLLLCGLLVGGMVSTAYLSLSSENLLMYRYVLAAVIVTGLCGILGFLEDTKGLTARFRFFMEALLAILLVTQGLTWTNIAIGSHTVAIPQYLSWILSILWIMWGINYFNFMDGINGLALFQAILTAGFYVAVGYKFNFPMLIIINIILILNCILLIPYNFPKARIFLGDAGSMTLGFFLAVCPMTIHNQRREFPMFHAILVVFPFFADALITLMRRVLEGAKITEAHRSHCYQVLAIHWRSHTKVALLYAAVSATIIVPLTLFYYTGIELGQYIAIAIAALTMLGMVCMQKRLFRKM